MIRMMFSYNRFVLGDIFL